MLWYDGEGIRVVETSHPSGDFYLSTPNGEIHFDYNHLKEVATSGEGTLEDSLRKISSFPNNLIGGHFGIPITEIRHVFAQTYIALLKDELNEAIERG